jgi:hypothetical protein
MSDDPGGDADTSPPGNPGIQPILDVVWQIRRIIYNRNIVEPITNPLGTGSPPTGFSINSNLIFDPYYVFGEVLVARNRIRNIDNGSDPYSVGMYVNSSEFAIVQKNIIGGIPDLPIRHYDIGVVKHLHNVSFTGELFQGVDTQGSQPWPYLNQLETVRDLALTAQPNPNPSSV